MDNNEIRINKYLSMAGYCSRRAADELIAKGKVFVDDVMAETGTKVQPGQAVTVDGEIIKLIDERRVFAFYKPVGYISSLSDEQGQGIGGFVPEGLRLYPVGRLDKDSEGLMLLTNDGDLMNGILKASEGHEKEYIVKVNKPITQDFLNNMEKGVLITNGATGKKVMTAPTKTCILDKKSFKIVLIQGLNRQIRRMCGSFEYKVLNLKRIRIMNIVIGDLKPGEFVEITGQELAQLKRLTLKGE